MIGFLRGRLLRASPERLLVDAGGVGYEVAVSLFTFSELERAGVGSEVELHVHTHVREDQLALYGFATELELVMFEKLIAVSGIGPKLALSVLSGIEPRDLAGAIQRNDIARLTAIPGVGKKTAERIVLELKDRVAQLGVAPDEAAAVASPGDRLRDDLLSALQNLGYHRPLAEKAADAALAAGSESTFEVALKTALRELMRGR